MDSERGMLEVHAKRRNFRIGLATAGLLVLVAVVFMVVTRQDPGTSHVGKGLLVAAFVVLFTTGIAAMGVACPHCRKPFHKYPMKALMRCPTCWNCGYPDAGSIDADRDSG